MQLRLKTALREPPTLANSRRGTPLWGGFLLFIHSFSFFRDVEDAAPYNGRCWRNQIGFAFHLAPAVGDGVLDVPRLAQFGFGVLPKRRAGKSARLITFAARAAKT